MNWAFSRQGSTGLIRPTEFPSGSSTTAHAPDPPLLEPRVRTYARTERASMTGPRSARIGTSEVDVSRVLQGLQCGR